MNRFLLLPFMLLTVSCMSSKRISEEERSVLSRYKTFYVKGVIRESEYNQSIPFANIIAYSDSAMITGAGADIDGEYIFDLSKEEVLKVTGFEITSAIFFYKKYIPKKDVRFTNDTIILNISLDINHAIYDTLPKSITIPSTGYPRPR